MPAFLRSTGLLLLLSQAAFAQHNIVELQQRLAPWMQVLSGRDNSFTISGTITAPVDGRPQSIRLNLVRYDDQAFDIELHHTDYAACVYRRSDRTAFVLPKHDAAYAGRGAVDDADNLRPRDLVARLVSTDSKLREHLLLLRGNAKLAAITLSALPGFAYDEAERTWQLDGVSIGFEDGLQITGPDLAIRLKLADAPAAVPAARVQTARVTALERNELERQLCRGVRRATEILAPGRSLTNPSQSARTVPNGELRWVDGQRLVLLQGSPKQIGKAHGQLLRTESEKCIDSVLNTFGTVQTIVTGRWFRHELEAAYARLAPHIPEDHKRETRALAKSLEMDTGLLETLNVFPELFHCSGFALFDSATSDGKLYHGRVLDYMTTIGLQDAATTFVVSPTGKHSFANIGYASFIGSVSGMNDQTISLGEMGGRGEGQWDGVPMATLMRRALEECSTLDEVKQLWTDSPRTCEYFYVFAEGRTNQAVGVAALPEKIEFVMPGQGHELLGTGIADAVVLSAGSRLEKLRERVTERHGTIDAESAMWLMSRPVAMQSNLHNVLFIPADGVFYVANASHRKPAAECGYVRYDLSQLLRSRLLTRSDQAKSSSDE